MVKNWTLVLTKKLDSPSAESARGAGADAFDVGKSLCWNSRGGVGYWNTQNNQRITM